MLPRFDYIDVDVEAPRLVEGIQVHNLAEDPMYNVRVDAVKNRIYITLSGFFSIEEITRCGAETIEATGKLKPGYDVVTDITQFKVGTPEVAKEIERVQAHFRVSGARQGVRIVGGNVSSGMQFYRTGSLAEYNSVNVPTLEAAEELLDKL